MSDWLLADDIINMIDEMAQDAKHPAFAHHGHTHFYSGPSRDVKRALSDPNTDNYRRGLRRRHVLNAIAIDDTRVGKFLLNFKGVGSAVIKGKGTFTYFEEHEEVDDAERVTQALLPWRHASRYFALNSWGHVSTTVSGAFDKGVYYTEEVPHLFDDMHNSPYLDPIKSAIEELFTPRKQAIEKVNLFPFAPIENVYKTVGIRQAHQVICRTEQRMALHEALKGIELKTIREGMKHAAQEVLSRPMEAFQYYLESKECYQVDRQLMMKHTAAKAKKSHIEPPAVRAKTKQENMKLFGLMALALVKTELDLTPATSRPSIPSFSLTGSKVTLAV